MTENNLIFQCCKNDPIFVITFAVAGEQKAYHVCKSCENLEYFKKFVIKKVSINSFAIDDSTSLADAAAGGPDN